MPKVVNKDAKYSVVHDKGDMVVRLIYRFGFREEALLTTEDHPDLVTMVNEVKTELGDSRGGVFYINEFGHVLVPNPSQVWMGHTVEGFYAGSYHHHLEFRFNGMILGPQPPEDLAVGSEWRGPHTGVPYVISADGRDIYFKRLTGPDTQRKYVLSDAIGPDPARRLVRRLARFKGPSGGRIYINEARHFFAPVSEGQNLKYMYMGDLGTDAWFPEPDVAPS